MSGVRPAAVSTRCAICGNEIARPSRRSAARPVLLAGGRCSSASAAARRLRQGRAAGHVPAGRRERPQDRRTCSGRCSSSPASSASSSSPSSSSCVIRFRDRGQEMPKQTHGKPALEIMLTIIPAVILIGRRHPHRQHGLRAGQDQRHAVRHQRHRPAVVVGVRLPGAGRRRRRDRRADRHQRRAGASPPTGPRAAAHHQPRRHPLVLDPEAQRQARRRARPRPPAAHGGRPPGHLRRASAPSSAASATPACAWTRSA